MGCLIILTCQEGTLEQQQRSSAATQTSRDTDPGACLSRPFETHPPHEWKNFRYREMIKASRAAKVLGRIEKGVHLLEKGLAVAHGAYRVGQAVAPFAAAML